MDGWIGRVACKGYLGLHPIITASTIGWMMMLVEMLKMLFGLISRLQKSPLSYLMQRREILYMHQVVFIGVYFTKVLISLHRSVHNILSVKMWLMNDQQSMYDLAMMKNDKDDRARVFRPPPLHYTPPIAGTSLASGRVQP